MIKYKHGNILDSKADILTNTINCVGVMGKGIALQFKNKFPKMFEEYRLLCSDKYIKPGKIWIYSNKETNGQIIFNFATKNHWRNNSKYEWIDSGLEHMSDILTHIKCPIGSIAIPPLGCGNGGLSWSIVSEKIINWASKHQHLEIEIYEP